LVRKTELESGRGRELIEILGDFFSHFPGSRRSSTQAHPFLDSEKEVRTRSLEESKGSNPSRLTNELMESSQRAPESDFQMRSYDLSAPVVSFSFLSPWKKLVIRSLAGVVLLSKEWNDKERDCEKGSGG